MSIRNAAALNVIVKDDFIKSVAPSEWEQMHAIFNELDISFDDLADALYWEDAELLGEYLEERFTSFQTLLEELEHKFFMQTGLFLNHLSINSDRDESELDDGHYFTIDFGQAYQLTPDAEKIKEHLSLEQWSVYVG